MAVGEYALEESEWIYVLTVCNDNSIIFNSVCRILLSHHLNQSIVTWKRLREALLSKQ